MKPLKVLVIDDERLIRWSFKKKLNPEMYKVYTEGTGEDGIEAFQMEQPDIVFLDNKLPKMQGTEVLRKIRSLNDEVVIVFMTAYETVKIAVEAMKSGASEYINKPFTFEQIELLLSNIHKSLKKDTELKLLKREQKGKITFNDIIGSSSVFTERKQMSQKIAKTGTTNILLLGESGTGKDLFARAIHNGSERKENPFITINCSALPETLLESELFGYEKGAFTDAKKQKKGLFEIAEKGTVFLDEIGEIQQTTQIKLLNVLENRVLRRLGGTTDIPVDIRIIAATNKDLKKSVDEKKFREDLYYRLKVFQIKIPALREHKKDIRELINHYIKLFNTQFGKNIKAAGPAVVDLMMQYNWPGNIRELRNVMERAVILETEDELTKESLPGEIRNHSKEPADCNPYNFSIPAEGFSLEKFEQQLIKQALERTENNQTQAAKLLGISRDTLRYKKKKHKL